MQKEFEFLTNLQARFYFKTIQVKFLKNLFLRIIRIIFTQIIAKTLFISSNMSLNLKDFFMS